MIVGPRRGGLCGSNRRYRSVIVIVEVRAVGSGLCAAGRVLYSRAVEWTNTVGKRQVSVFGLLPLPTS